MQVLAKFDFPNKCKAFLTLTTAYHDWVQPKYPQKLLSSNKIIPKNCKLLRTKFTEKSFFFWLFFPLLNFLCNFDFYIFPFSVSFHFFLFFFTLYATSYIFYFLFNSRTVSFALVIHSKSKVRLKSLIGCTAVSPSSREQFTFLRLVYSA